MRNVIVFQRPSYILNSAFAFLIVVGCDSSKPPSSPGNPPASVVVYCSVDTAFAEPILAEFEKRTGIKVHHIFDTEAGKTTGLVNKLLAEKATPRADVWWSSEIFGTIQLAGQGVLEPFRPVSAADVPKSYRDPEGMWTAVGLRGRVIAFDPQRVRKEDLPRRWWDLTDAKYKDRFRMADPRFGTTRGHMATLLSLWGEPAMRDFYARLHDNGCQLTDGNSQSVLLVTRGLADLAATDTDDVIAAQLSGASIDMVYPDLEGPDGTKGPPGTLWIPCTVALVKGTTRSEAARRLIEYLVSAEVEEKLYQSDSRNFPVRLALRDKLKVSPPAEGQVDYAVAAKALTHSDRLVTTVLMR